jgi:hypothetical protein
VGHRESVRSEVKTTHFYFNSLRDYPPAEPDGKWTTTAYGKRMVYVHPAIWGRVPDKLKRLARGRVIVRQ